MTPILSPLEPRSFLSRSCLRDLPLKSAHTSSCLRVVNGKTPRQDTVLGQHPEFIGTGHFHFSS